MSSLLLCTDYNNPFKRNMKAISNQIHLHYPWMKYTRGLTALVPFWYIIDVWTVVHSRGKALLLIMYYCLIRFLPDFRHVQICWCVSWLKYWSVLLWHRHWHISLLITFNFRYGHTRWITPSVGQSAFADYIQQEGNHTKVTEQLQHKHVLHKIESVIIW